jgi:4-hydroxy-3-polyprenylbenzoate decarboxylase
MERFFITYSAMSYRGLSDFISHLEREGELLRITGFADPMLEITEITDRITKSDGKALLFENNGTGFPLLINAFGSRKRMAMAMGRGNLDDAGREIEELFNIMTSPGKQSLIGKLRGLPQMMRYAKLLPKRVGGRGRCQQVVMKNPDLSQFPVLKCWPHDGGRFITLPAVHTFHPETRRTNVGMYRMQIFDNVTTGMHWHRHKTGANHFEAWKKAGKLMPVAVTLGGDPVFTYAATAPLPENIDEYILAGFLRKKRVEKVRCLTQDIWVPADADIVIEGYVDPAGQLLREGPFGDHTGVYSLADWYPAFHVTAITHARDAVYPATIVGVPPQEDAWIGEATEKIFLSPIKLTLAPEVTDLHMPIEGVAHNLVIVKISKSYPGQGLKVLNSLYGAGQMMFSKFIVVVSCETDIRNYNEVLTQIELNCSFSSDLMRLKGPLDVLDHSSDTFSFGGKMGIDATVKLPEEMNADENMVFADATSLGKAGSELVLKYPETFSDYQIVSKGFLAMVVRSQSSSIPAGISEVLNGQYGRIVMLLVEEGIPYGDTSVIAWQVTGNTDPVRDITITKHAIIIDSLFKNRSGRVFTRPWPNVVLSSEETIAEIDRRWHDITGGGPIESPSARIRGMARGDKAETGD